jgi:hypothetical protein
VFLCGRAGGFLTAESAENTEKELNVPPPSHPLCALRVLCGRAEGFFTAEGAENTERS